MHRGILEDTSDTGVSAHSGWCAPPVRLAHLDLRAGAAR